MLYPRVRAISLSRAVAAAGPAGKGEDIIKAYGAEDAVLSVKLKGRGKRADFRLGEAFHTGRSSRGNCAWEDVRADETSR